MNLLSAEFGLCLLVVLNLSLLLRRTGVYKYFLLLLGLCFYATFGWPSLLILLGNLCLNYAANLIISKTSHKKAFLVVFVALNTIFLAGFKFFRDLVDVAASLNVSTQLLLDPAEVLVLFGVSYFTFKNIAHLIEMGRGKIALPDFASFALYVSFFPQIGAGPISRPQDFYPQLQAIRTAPLAYPFKKVRLILMHLGGGLFKKLLLGTIFFNIAFNAFQGPMGFAPLDLVVAVLAYTFFIYLDFSGYSNLSNAVSLLLGFEETRNFESPYLSVSVKEFWERWHISLSSWLRDYIYIPLGGNALGEARKYLNFLITFTIGAIWHGIGWNFLIWGLLNAFGVVASHFQEKHLGKLRSFLKPLAWLVTFVFIMITWVFFFTPNPETALSLFKGIFTPYTADISLATPVVLGLCLGGGLLILSEKWLGKIIDILLEKMGIILALFVVCLFILGVIYLMPNEVPSFVYFGF